MTSTLTERLADWHHALAVDPAARLVRNVALTGRDSRNGYRYSETALRAAVLLYDQKPVFLDHAAERSRPLERSTRDLVGTIEAPRFEEGRIRADIRTLETDAGRTFLALAQSNAPGVGMSHVVLARRSADGATVDSIEDVISVDAVINPATTTTFRESQSGESMSPPADAGEPPASAEAAELVEQTAALTAELAQLRERLCALELEREQEVHAQRMDALLSSSGLPGYALTPQFRQQLESAASDEVRRALVRERLDLLTRAARQPPSSQPRPAGSVADTTPAFLAVLKRR